MLFILFGKSLLLQELLHRLAAEAKDRSTGGQVHGVFLCCEHIGWCSVSSSDYETLRGPPTDSFYGYMIIDDMQSVCSLVTASLQSQPNRLGKRYGQPALIEKK